MKRWACIYCGTDWDSLAGTGTDVRCCGEVGHVIEADFVDGVLQWPADEPTTEEIEA